MGFFDVLRGRSSAPKPNLDNLFAVPGAAISLQSAMSATATGVGSVCYRAASGAAMADTQADATAIIESDGVGKVERTVDGFGFTWSVVRGDPTDVSGLVTDLHALNTDLETQGFAGSLLCSVVGFHSSDGQPFGLVYLYKQGTFYPFAQQGTAKTRDALLERQVRDAVAGDVPIEADTSRWLPLWDCPGLT
ncbi:MAG TPA: hypothetical protein VF426_02770 [Marmoricola sp.]